MEQQAKIKLLKEIGLFLDTMKPNDRLEIVMKENGKVQYELRSVNRGII